MNSYECEGALITERRTSGLSLADHLKHTRPDLYMGLKLGPFVLPLLYRPLPPTPDVKYDSFQQLRISHDGLKVAAVGADREFKNLIVNNQILKAGAYDEMIIEADEYNLNTFYVRSKNKLGLWELDLVNEKRELVSLVSEAETIYPDSKFHNSNTNPGYFIKQGGVNGVNYYQEYSTSSQKAAVSFLIPDEVDIAKARRNNRDLPSKVFWWYQKTARSQDLYQNSDIVAQNIILPFIEKDNYALLCEGENGTFQVNLNGKTHDIPEGKKPFNYMSTQVRLINEPLIALTVADDQGQSIFWATNNHASLVGNYQEVGELTIEGDLVRFKAILENGEDYDVEIDTGLSIEDAPGSPDSPPPLPSGVIRSTLSYEDGMPFLGAQTQP